MISTLIAFIGLIQLTTSSLDLTSKILEGARRAEDSGSSSSAVERNYGFTSLHGENQLEHKLNHILPNLDRTHVTRILESNKKGPYFWHNGLLRSNTHVSLESIEQMKKHMSQVGIMEKVDIIKKECLILKRNLESHQELRLLVDHDAHQNAHEILGFFLEQILNSLNGLFSLGHMENHRALMLNESLQKIHWQSLISNVHKTIDQLKGLLLRFDSHQDFAQEECLHTLTTQVINTFNFLIKNALIEEEVLEELVEREEVKNLISNHITKLLKKTDFLGLDFRECLMKSISTEHLVFVLKFFREEDLKLVEYNFLKKNIEYLNQSWGNELFKNMPLGKKFCDAGFEMNYEKSYTNHYSPMRINQRHVFKTIYHYFNRNTNIRTLEDDIRSKWFDYQDNKCGIIYDMLCFLIRYHPDLIEESLGNEESIHLFNLKWNILDSALRYKRSAEVLELVRFHGFWTSELNFVSSKNQIALEEVQKWSPSPNKETNYFMKNIRCYTSKDFDMWKDLFRTTSLDQIGDDMKDPECINRQYPTASSLEYFGTNFKLQDEDHDNLSQDKQILTKEPMISMLFLNDLYSWIEKFKFIWENHKINNNIMKEILQIATSSNTQSLPLDIDDWVRSSDMMRAVNVKTLSQSKISRETWHDISGKMALLNKIAKERMKNRIIFKDFFHHSILQRTDFENQDILKIPEIDFGL